MNRPVYLPPDLEAYAEARVAAGEYATVDEAVGAALVLLRERDEKKARFRSLIAEGYRSLEDGPPCSVEEAIAEFDRMVASGKATGA